MEKFQMIITSANPHEARIRVLPARAIVFKAIKHEGTLSNSDVATRFKTGSNCDGYITSKIETAARTKARAAMNKERRESESKIKKY